MMFELTWKRQMSPPPAGLRWWPWWRQWQWQHHDSDKPLLLAALRVRIQNRSSGGNCVPCPGTEQRHCSGLNPECGEVTRSFRWSCERIWLLVSSGGHVTETNSIHCSPVQVWPWSERKSFAIRNWVAYAPHLWNPVQFWPLPKREKFGQVFRSCGWHAHCVWGWDEGWLVPYMPGGESWCRPKVLLRLKPSSKFRGRGRGWTRRMNEHIIFLLWQFGKKYVYSTGSKGGGEFDRLVQIERK